jgi:hypothetical protein
LGLRGWGRYLLGAREEAAKALADLIAALDKGGDARADGIECGHRLAGVNGLIDDALQPLRGLASIVGGAVTARRGFAQVERGFGAAGQGVLGITDGVSEGGDVGGGGERGEFIGTLCETRRGLSATLGALGQTGFDLSCALFETRGEVCQESIKAAQGGTYAVLGLRCGLGKLRAAGVRLRDLVVEVMGEFVRAGFLAVEEGVECAALFAQLLDVASLRVGLGRGVLDLRECGLGEGRERSDAFSEICLGPEDLCLAACGELSIEAGERLFESLLGSGVDAGLCLRGGTIDDLEHAGFEGAQVRREEFLDSFAARPHLRDDGLLGGLEKFLGPRGTLVKLVRGLRGLFDTALEIALQRGGLIGHGLDAARVLAEEFLVCRRVAEEGAERGREFFDGALIHNSGRDEGPR